MTTTVAVEKAQQASRLIPVLFTATIFTSALLLFFVQPLFTRMVLPQIGGAAAVWTTAMLFFQTVLIGGYLYAHLLTRHVPQMAQIGIHISLLLLALFFLPLAVPESWRYDPANPVVTQTLWLYALGVGLPFAVLSANAPLIQSWYRRSGGPSAEDPYFLYAASNLGSLVALLAFPLIAEPLFGIKSISGAWSIGFIALGPMLLLSGFAARQPAPVSAGVESAGDSTDGADDKLGFATLARWAFLAFLPSSLMLCVTSKISTDLGSFPLVWVVPLALYLLTFVMVFSAGSKLTADRLHKVLPIAIGILVFFSLKSTASLIGFVLLLSAFFVVGLLAHRILFERRPNARHLTVFYLTMSVGGALGGLFNSIFAPLVFDRLLEFPVTIALISLLLLVRPATNMGRDIAIGLAFGALTLVPLLLNVDVLEQRDGQGKALIAICVLLTAFAFFKTKPTVAVTAAMATLVIWSFFGRGDLLFLDRSFFGVHFVVQKEEYREYWNGTTIHGVQVNDETGPRPIPTAYYHPKGLMGQIVSSDLGEKARTVGVVGLGIGGLACYSRPGQDWHYYEIDQKVIDIAMDPTLFTFMRDCAKDGQVHVGDARIVLQDQKDLTFDLLVIDAYGSDAIPVHLATAEAIQLYLDRLSKDGILVFHISNRFYDLAQPLAVAVKAFGLEGRVRTQRFKDLEGAVGAFPSNVVVIGRSAAALGDIATNPDWKLLPEPRIDLWTDDHADLLAALK